MEEADVILETYIERYEFRCRKCDFPWEDTYLVRCLEDEQGGFWNYYYTVTGVSVTAPVAGVGCPNCGSSSVANRNLDRRLTTSDVEELLSTESSAAGQTVRGTVLPTGTSVEESMSTEPGGSVRRPRIVVGIDGSPACQRALQWASEQAHLVGGELEVDLAWEHEAGFGFTGVGVKADEENARRNAESLVAQVLGRSPHVPVEIVVRRGRSGEQLVEASRDASLLVVGSHGHGQVLDVLIGSVAEYCVHHAHCPVVVIRADSSHQRMAKENLPNSSRKKRSSHS